MEMEEDTPTYRPRSSKQSGGVILPELDVFLHLMVLLRLLDTNNIEKVGVVKVLSSHLHDTD